MIRFLRRFLALFTIAIAVGMVAFKGWLELSGPYLEGLPLYPYCQEAAQALAEDRISDALEFAEAGDCPAEAERARELWDSLAANFERCIEGIWTGRAEDMAGIACAIASDLVVFGDVRDLTRQGIAWGRGEETDLFLVSLSAAGLALTLVPQAGAGSSLMKLARKAGTLSDGLASSISSLIRRGALGPLGNLLSDAGRITAKVGPARATRALAYADDAEELGEVARFVDSAAHPLMGLRLGGKRVLSLVDEPVVYREALSRGPSGLALAVERGGGALLSRKPLLLFVGKVLYKDPLAVGAALLALATWLLKWVSWRLVLIAAGVLLMVAAVNYPYESHRRPGRRQRVRAGA